MMALEWSAPKVAPLLNPMPFSANFLSPGSDSIWHHKGHSKVNGMCSSQCVSSLSPFHLLCLPAVAQEFCPNSRGRALMSPLGLAGWFAFSAGQSFSGCVWGDDILNHIFECKVKYFQGNRHFVQEIIEQAICIACAKNSTMYESQASSRPDVNTAPHKGKKIK